MGRRASRRSPEIREPRPALGTSLTSIWAPCQRAWHADVTLHGPSPSCDAEVWPRPLACSQQTTRRMWPLSTTNGTIVPRRVKEEPATRGSRVPAAPAERNPDST